MKKNTTARVQKVRDRFKETQIDTLLVTIQENRRYLSGFTGHDGQFDETAGALFITPDHLKLATDGRYTLQASKEAPEYKVITYDKGLPQAIPDILDELKTKRLGFESERMSVAQYDKILGIIKKSGLNIKIVPTHDLVEAIRIIKDDEEVAHTRSALAIAEAAFNKIIPTLRPGMTELEIAWNLEKMIRETCPDGLSFPVIVAAGPNSALPHAIPGDRPVKSSEPILFDWGARQSGYCSDTSRTVILQKPDATFESVYQAVREAQEKAIAAIKPGMSGKEVDAVARGHIDAAGYSGKFNHGLGHGTGLAIHENPRLGPTSDSVLEPGMICTVEPGVYIAQWGGIRLENQVLVTEKGAEVLNRLGMDNYIISK